MRGLEWVEGWMGTETEKYFKKNNEGGKKKVRWSRARDRLSGRKERCGSMWGMSITLMNYLRLEIPRPSRGLLAALWSGRGWGGWMGGAMSAPYPLLHPCHRSSNPQCCAADGGLMGGEWKSFLERVQYVYTWAESENISWSMCMCDCVHSRSACRGCSMTKASECTKVNWNVKLAPCRDILRSF